MSAWSRSSAAGAILALVVGAAAAHCSDDSGNGRTDATGASDGAQRDTAASDDAPSADATATLDECRHTCKSLIDCGAGACLDKRCVQCAKDSDCSTPFRGCDEKRHICQLCRDDSDCRSGGQTTLTGKCDTQTWTCTRCSSASECQIGPYRYCFGGRCSICRTDADCASSPTKGCNPKTGRCSLCTADAQCCPKNKPGCGLHCDTASGSCTCDTDQQCTDTFGSNRGSWKCSAE